MNATYNARNIHATRMDHDLYNYSPFVSRPSWHWPNGARVAVTFSVAVEFQDLILPSGTWRPAVAPVALDVRNWSHRDYGARVGIFRLVRMLAEYGIKGTAPVSDTVVTRSPRVIEFLAESGWELAGHGAKSNHLITSAMSEEAEWEYLLASRDTLQKATGVAPRGWLGPLSSESSRTPFLAAKAGYDYLLDWSNDDQPYDMLPPVGRLTALPVSAETSDQLVIVNQNHTPADYLKILCDHFDMLYAEGANTAMGMVVNLSAYLSGEPFRSKYIRAFVDYVSRRSGTWFPTAAEMTDAYRSSVLQPV